VDSTSTHTRLRSLKREIKGLQMKGIHHAFAAKNASLIAFQSNDLGMILCCEIGRGRKIKPSKIT
jgi:hypothetical protein